MSKFLYLNTSSEIWGILLCVTCIACSMMLKVEQKTMKRSFIRLFLCEAMILVSDIIGINCEGRPGALMHACVLSANVVTFSFSFLLLALFTEYAVGIVEEACGTHYRMKKRVDVICAILILLCIANFFIPVYFTVTPDNIYHRAGFFWVSQVSGIAIALVNQILVIRNRRKLSKATVVCFSLYTILPVFSMIVQLLFYGIMILNISTTILLMVCFLAMMFETNQLIYEQEIALAKQGAELADSRTRIMLSQIQPHFIYNALNSIYYLCGKNPKLAQKAVGDFSDYLRVNLDSLNKKESVPFHKELEHVRTYLWLEQLRFDERLKVEYNIQTEDFRIPVLTVQPLVENAVKHGICNVPDGGCVRISTKDAGEHYEICIEDDGIGFDPTAVLQDGRPHVGIENVRRRLHAECKGILTIESEPGRGCRAVICLPKEAK